MSLSNLIEFFCYRPILNYNYSLKVIKLLQAELKIEREHNRDISNKLIELTNNSQELTRNSQVLLKQEQDKTALLLPEQEEKKKGFFKKIFNKNK